MLKIFGDLSRYLLELYKGSYREKELNKAIQSTFQEGMIACTDFSPCHPIAMRLQMSIAKFYYENMNSLEFAIKYTSQAIAAAKEEAPIYFNNMETGAKEIEGAQEAIEVLE